MDARVGKLHPDGQVIKIFSRQQAKTHKLSVNVNAEVGTRLHELAFQGRFSESSIVDIALRDLFKRGNNVVLVEFLRDRGATLRRK